MRRRNIRKVQKRNRAGEPTGGFVYRARYEGPDGKERTRHFQTKKDATKWLNEQSAQIVTGMYVDPNAGKITFRDYAEAWRDRQVHRPTTASDYEVQLRLHTYPTLGNTSLNELQPAQIQAWVKSLSESLAPATVRKIHGIIAGILNDAVKDRRLAFNPCVGTRLPEIPERRITILTSQQVHDLWRYMVPEYKALVHLAAATGMRQSEVFGLTADRVNFLKRELTVDRQLIRAGGAYTFGPPKSRKSNRVIPIPAELVDALEKHVDTFGLGEDGLVFTARDRGPVRKTTFNDGALKIAKTKAGVPAATFHWLRHYYASLLIRYGESVKTVQARLGHATAAETLDTYGHLWPDSDDRTRQAASTALWVPESAAQNEGTTGGQRAADTPA
jgi:integrase